MPLLELLSLVQYLLSSLAAGARACVAEEQPSEQNYEREEEDADYDQPDHCGVVEGGYVG